MSETRENLPLQRLNTQSGFGKTEDQKNVADPSFKIGENIGGYRLTRFIARGGMGEVYEARQAQPDRRVAIKLVSPERLEDLRRKDRFFKEIRVSSQVQHPNLVTFFDAGVDRGIPYLVMEFVEGDNLQNLVHTSGPLPENRALRIAAHVARPLATAWDERQILHRDIKPDNILFDIRDGRIRLTDFGLGTIENESGDLTFTHLLIGSPDFMSPEQAADPTDLDQRSDMYALGCTLYFLLTGMPPFSRTDVAAVLRAHQTETFPDPRVGNPEISEACWRLLQGMTAKARAARYRTWQPLLDDLHDVRKGRMPSRWNAQQRGNEGHSLAQNSAEKMASIKNPPWRRLLRGLSGRGGGGDR